MPRKSRKAADKEDLAMLRLPADLTIKEAAAVREQCLAALAEGQPVTVDGSGVAAVDTAGIQLLAALRVASQRRGVAFAWSGASPAIVDAAGRLGLAQALGLDG